MDHLISLYPKLKSQIKILNVIFENSVKTELYSRLSLPRSTVNIFRAMADPNQLSDSKNSIEAAIKKYNNKTLEKIFKAISNKSVKVDFFTYVFLELKFKDTNLKKVSFKSELDRIFYLLYKNQINKEFYTILKNEETGLIHALYFYSKDINIKKILLQRKDLNIFVFYDLIKKAPKHEDYIKFINCFLSSNKKDQLEILTYKDLDKKLFLKYLLSETMVKYILSENNNLINDLINTILYIDVEDLVKIKFINSLLRAFFVLKRVDLFFEYFEREQELLKKEPNEYKIYNFLYYFLKRRKDNNIFSFQTKIYNFEDKNEFHVFSLEEFLDSLDFLYK